ncbi:MAG: hypothetical protein EBS48_09190 [Actinobacteria bacterium]|nr:hypothetical protein [Actinomycetota bacterium]
MAALSDVLDHVSCFLEDKSPLACVASSARCSCHFSSYLVAGQSEIRVACSECSHEMQTRVFHHEHPREGLIVYHGAPHSYAWDTTTDLLLCRGCYASLLQPPCPQVQSLARSFEKAVNLGDAADAGHAPPVFFDRHA